MFEPDNVAKGDTPPHRTTHLPLRLGAADRFRLVDHLGARYFAMRVARRDIYRSLSALEPALERGDAVPPALLEALYRYELARSAWHAGYRTLVTMLGADTAKRV